jgi:uncharacterized RDD family membrane protein YckC
MMMDALILAAVWVAVGLALYTRPHMFCGGDAPWYLIVGSVFSWPFFLALGWYGSEQNKGDK